jgi:hypothetical protein
MAMNTTELVSSERLRQVTLTIWLAWVLVSALVPVFSTIVATALAKQISPTAEHRALIMNGLWALIAFAVLAPPIMQGFVLKRVLPKLSVWVWLFCILLADILWLALTLGEVFLLKTGFPTLSLFQIQLLIIAVSRYLAGTLSAFGAAYIRVLPWGPLLLWTAAASTLMSLVPAWALGIASGRRRATLLFLLASIVGALASTVVEQLYNMIVNDRIPRNWALNGLAWTERFQIVAGRAGVGAVWGAITAIFMVLTVAVNGSGRRQYRIHL